MKCRDKLEENKRVLNSLVELFKIDKSVDTLLNDYYTIYSSYENQEKYERLRIIGTKPKNKNDDTGNDTKSKKAKNKNRKKDILFTLGKKDISKNNLDIELEKLNADLFCKIWQQTRQLIQLEKLENTITEIKDNITKKEIDLDRN